MSTKITLKWECLGKVEPKSSRVSKFISTKYFSAIMRNIHVVHDGKICRCCVNVDGVSGNSEISMAVNSEYIATN